MYPASSLSGTFSKQTQNWLQGSNSMSSKALKGNSAHSHIIAEPSGPISMMSVLDSLKSSSTSSPRRLRKRIISYALVELYPRGTSFSPFVVQLKAQTGASDISLNQMYRVRKIGHRWQAIVSWASRQSDQPLTGILLILDDTW